MASNHTMSNLEVKLANSDDQAQNQLLDLGKEI